VDASEQTLDVVVTRRGNYVPANYFPCAFRLLYSRLLGTWHYMSAFSIGGRISAGHFTISQAWMDPSYLGGSFASAGNW
jgi:hypothetical protein